MTPKKRLLAALRGEEVDRIPWSPFLAYIWESFPKGIQKKGQLYFMEEIGADPLFRGFQRLFSVQRNRCSIIESIKGREKLTLYETPIGKLQARHVYSPAGNTWFIMDHPVKTREDFKILTYLNEDMTLLPQLDDFEKQYDEVGERGLHMPLIGSEGKSSLQSMLEYWVGTQELVYALMDYPETVEECLNTMQRNSIRSVEISVESSAEAFIFWEDSSTTNISPGYFRKYTAPEINTWGRIIHNAGKYLVHHACGHLKGLLPIMGKTQIDVVESISPPPTGNMELWDARSLLPDQIGLVGGIEPTVFLNSTMEELEGYVERLLQKMGRKRFILANSDSCPPGVTVEKFKKVTEVVSRN